MQNINTDQILIIGMGVTGVSILNYLSSRCRKISIYDKNKSLDQLKEIGRNHKIENYFWNDINEIPFENFDCVALSPGIKLDNNIQAKLKKNRVAIINDLYFLAKEINDNNCKLIGVTGTNGKTTTCSLLKFFLTEYGINTEAVGNIGKPVLDIIPNKNLEVLIVELSSFQLEINNDLKFHVGVTLNISEDHLDRYEKFKDYVEAKKNLHRQSIKKIINYDDPNLHDWYDKDTTSLSLLFKEDCPDYYVSKLPNKTLIHDKKGFLLDVSAMTLKGNHNVFNIMAAVAAIRLIFPKFDFTKIALEKFNAIPHRLEWVRNIKGIDFYNDSKATNIASSIAAVKSFPNKKIHLIVGGDSKNQSLEPLREIVGNNVLTLALIGKDAKLFQEKFSNIKNLSIKNCGAMDTAVKFVYAQAKKGQIILLAPACASTDMYKNYMARGDDFTNNVHLLT